MALPANFTEFVRPVSLMSDAGWYEELCYQPRFIVFGYSNALRLLPPLEGKHHRRRARELFRNQAERDEFNSYIPQAWKAAIPDENDGQMARNTYWRWHSDNQSERAERKEYQTLPAALCSIAAIYFAAEKSKVTIDLVKGDTEVHIRPSLFWMDGYDGDVYLRSVRPTEADAYKHCQLRRSITPSLKARTLEDATKGTCTWHTVDRLKDYLTKAGEKGLGDINRTENRRRKIMSRGEIRCAKEHFLANNIL